jgi:hypothetical protein
MRTERIRHLTKGARDLCASARSLCAKLELRSGDVAAALERCFAPFLDGEVLELGRSCHALAAAREERDQAMDELHRYATGVRGVLRAVCALPAGGG